MISATVLNELIPAEEDGDAYYLDDLGGESSQNVIE